MGMEVTDIYAKDGERKTFFTHWIRKYVPDFLTCNETQLKRSSYNE